MPGHFLEYLVSYQVWRSPTPGNLILDVVLEVVADYLFLTK